MVNPHRFHIPLTDLPEAQGAMASDRVYMDFFRFKYPPFAITPDPEFLFLSETHQNAIEKIQYGIRSRQGFMLLTGEVGTGKSTLCRVILDFLQDHAQTVYVINPSLKTEELFATILDDLGVPRTENATKKGLIDQLNVHLLSRSHSGPVVIIIDDAQSMSSDTLEDMRLLSNLESDKEKLLQVLLVGQPELRDQIEDPRMRQLRQRVAVSCCLDFLKADEVVRYIERRLFIAGNNGQVRFTPRLARQIHKQSQGIPRLINKICDLALTAGYAADSAMIDIPHLKAAKNEMMGLMARKPHRRPKTGNRAPGFPMMAATAIGMIVVMLLGGGLFFYRDGRFRERVSRPAPLKTTESVAEIVRKSGAGDFNTPDTKATPVLWPGSGGDQVGGYILQLGSYKSLETTLRAIDIYARQHIDAYWAILPWHEDIVWYRVFAGRFASRQQALAYQQSHALGDAVVRYAPWTVVVGEAGTTEQIATLGELLNVYRLSGYEVPLGGGRWHLLSGAFLSRESAEATAGRIQGRTGLATRITDLGREGTEVLSHQPKHEVKYPS